MKYKFSFDDFDLWRCAYEGGQAFVDQYLIKFSNRETDAEFTARKSISYAPTFAKAAINEVKNAIFQRLNEVKRTDIPEIYSRIVNGKDGGIDGIGSSMEHFLGQHILPELLVMQKVGIFVDREPLAGPTIKDTLDNNPYCYYYTREQILNITYNRRGKIVRLLLQECNVKQENVFGLNLTDETDVRYKFVFIDPNTKKVVIRYYQKSPLEWLKLDSTSRVDLPTLQDDIITNLTEIPFVLVELSDSLMRDIAGYQVALLNMASSDINYILKANIPFYVEQISKTEAQGFKNLGQDGTDQTGPETNVGPAQGRRYVEGLQTPAFIHPSSEPLQASMDRQEACKAEIRLLLNLNITNLKPTKAISAESKAKDEGSLESGLSYIGLALQHAERQIASFFCQYLGLENKIQVNYPEKYSLKTEEERRLEAKELSEQVANATSKTFKKELLKKIVELTLGNSVSEDKLNKIKAEIEADSILVSSNDLMKLTTLLDEEWLVQFLGFPKEAVKIIEEPAPNEGTT